MRKIVVLTLTAFCGMVLAVDSRLGRGTLGGELVVIPVCEAELRATSGAGHTSDVQVETTAEGLQVTGDWRWGGEVHDFACVTNPDGSAPGVGIADD